MRLLLDTHIWIEYHSGSMDPQSGVREAIENENNEVLLSPISIWETLILAQKGRLRLHPDAVAWVRTVLSLRITNEAPLNNEIAILSGTVSLPHEDPADRFLVATARIYQATLVTNDRRLLESDEIDTL